MMYTRTNEVTLLARWDETENCGIIHLAKTELDKLKENADLHNRKNVDSILMHSIVTNVLCTSNYQKWY